MNPERRAELEARAFPEGGVQAWRARISITFLVCVVLGFAGQPFVAALVFLTAVPTIVRYVRRELALGALLANEQAATAHRDRIPATDLREGPRIPR